MNIYGMYIDDKKLSDMVPCIPIGKINPGKESMLVAVDASNEIYRSIKAMPKLTTLTNSRGEITSHINTIFNKIVAFAREKIYLVYVFDNPNPNPMKEGELRKRRERKEKINARTDLTQEEKDKMQFTISAKYVNDIKRLLGLMGVPYYEIPEPGLEAEQVCAALTRAGKCSYVLSADADVIMFGGNALRVVKGVKKDGTTANRTCYQKFDMSTVTELTQLRYEDIVKIGVMLGTDFNDKTPGVGEKTAIRSLGTKSLTSDQIRAYEYFTMPVDANLKFRTSEIDPDGLLAFLVDENGFSADRVKKSLDEFMSK